MLISARIKIRREMRNTVERPIGFRQSSCMLRGHEQCNGYGSSVPVGRVANYCCTVAWDYDFFLAIGRGHRDGRNDHHQSWSWNETLRQKQWDFNLLRRGKMAASVRRTAPSSSARPA